jgi:hypothetical protein
VRALKIRISLLDFGAASERKPELVNGRITRLQEIGKLVQKRDYLVVARA